MNNRIELGRMLEQLRKISPTEAESFKASLSIDKLSDLDSRLSSLPPEEREDKIGSIVSNLRNRITSIKELKLKSIRGAVSDALSRFEETRETFLRRGDLPRITADKVTQRKLSLAKDKLKRELVEKARKQLGSRPKILKEYLDYELERDVDREFEEIKSRIIAEGEDAARSLSGAITADAEEEIENKIKKESDNIRKRLISDANRRFRDYPSRLEKYLSNQLEKDFDREISDLRARLRSEYSRRYKIPQRPRRAVGSKPPGMRLRSIQTVDAPVYDFTHRGVKFRIYEEIGEGFKIDIVYEPREMMDADLSVRSTSVVDRMYKTLEEAVESVIKTIDRIEDKYKESRLGMRREEFKSGIKARSSKGSGVRIRSGDSEKEVKPKIKIREHLDVNYRIIKKPLGYFVVIDNDPLKRFRKKVVDTFEKNYFSTMKDAESAAIRFIDKTIRDGRLTEEELKYIRAGKIKRPIKEASSEDIFEDSDLGPISNRNFDHLNVEFNVIKTERGYSPKIYNDILHKYSATKEFEKNLFASVSKAKNETILFIVSMMPAISPADREKIRRGEINPPLASHKKNAYNYLKKSEMLWERYIKKPKKGDLMNCYEALINARREGKYIRDSKVLRQANAGIKACEREFNHLIHRASTSNFRK